MQGLEDIQSAILEEIRSHFSATVFDLWFKDLSLSVLDESKAVFTIPSDFKRNILEKQHAEMLARATETVIGFPVSVSVLSSQQGTSPSPTRFSTPAPSHLSREARTHVIPEEPVDIGAELESNKIFSRYTFDNFIVGASNKFAHAACINVANDPGTDNNPLFIWGKSGLGKTHLLYAITNRIKSTRPNVRILYKSGADFANEMIENIQRGSMPSFREKYRSADVLLIDDIQFIAGKESTQEEFFHTFEALINAEKQIILTSDRPPRDIKTLEDRLRTRFEWGLTVDIQPPTIELRTAIIRSKAEALGISIPPDAMTYLSEKLTNSIRTIEGAIHKIQAISSLTGTPITLDLCRQATLSLIGNEKNEENKIDRIFDAVCAHYKVEREELCGKKRTDNLAKARHTCIYLIRQLTELSLSDIGRIFSRDHTTVFASIKYVTGQIESVPGAESEIGDLLAQLSTD